MFLAYFLMKMKCGFEKKFSLYIRFECYIPSTFKESLCFLCWILHSFLFLKLLALSYRYYSLGLVNIHFIFLCMLWFVLDLECMSDPCCFESFFAWDDSCIFLPADFFIAW